MAPSRYPTVFLANYPSSRPIPKYRRPSSSIQAPAPPDCSHLRPTRDGPGARAAVLPRSIVAREHERMTSWRLLNDFNFNVTASLVAVLDTKLDELETALEPESVLVEDLLEECDHVLGLGLVALQSYLSDTHLTVRDVTRGGGRTVGPKMRALRQGVGDLVAGTALDTAVREVDAMWHLANFWKHRDDWDYDWSIEAKNPRSGDTILGLKALGIGAATAFPIRAGVERIAGAARLKPLLDRATSWRETCLSTYAARSPAT